MLYWLGDTKSPSKTQKKGVNTTAMFRQIMKILALAVAVLLLALLMGCSVTSLSCGVDGDSSFVNLNATPKTLSQNTRNMAELCGFAYEEKTDAETTT